MGGSRPATDPSEQWLRAVFSAPRQVREVSVLPVVDDDQTVTPRRAGASGRAAGAPVAVNPSGAPSVAASTGRRWGRSRCASSAWPPVPPWRRTGLLARSPSTTSSRTAPSRCRAWSTPAPRSISGPHPERRACNITIDVPTAASADPGPEEADGHRPDVRRGERRERVRSRPAWVLPRATSEATRLLEPFDRQRVGVTSVFGSDPKVAGRFAYDDQVSTAWVSAPQDRHPTLLFRWDKRRPSTAMPSSTRRAGRADHGHRPGQRT